SFELAVVASADLIWPALTAFTPVSLTEVTRIAPLPSMQPVRTREARTTAATRGGAAERRRKASGTRWDVTHHVPDYGGARGGWGARSALFPCDFGLAARDRQHDAQTDRNHEPNDDPYG